MTYPVELSLILRPVNHRRDVSVRLGIDQDITVIKIRDQITIDWKFATTHQSVLSVELCDKQDQEAVVIEQVGFFGITDPRFAWAGTYEPIYPEPWATQQKTQGQILADRLSPHTYLSWPGEWRLVFSVPVFTWIHRLQNLGWIYD